LGWVKQDMPEMMDTSTFVLQAPPSINPQKPTPPPPPVEDVKRPTEQYLEMLAAKKEELVDPPPPTQDELNKIIDKTKSDSTNDRSNDAQNDGKNNGGAGKIWTKVQQLPEFMGGEEAYYRFMSENMVYPQAEYDDGIEGVTRVYFVVNQDGSLEQIKVIKSSGNPNLDAEALRLIKLQPNYRPGMQHGIPVRVSCMIDIEFKL
jgi:periplasmic protein TonB